MFDHVLCWCFTGKVYPLEANPDQVGQNQPFCITHLLLCFLLCFSSHPPPPPEPSWDPSIFNIHTYMSSFSHLSVWTLQNFCPAARWRQQCQYLSAECLHLTFFCTPSATTPPHIHTKKTLPPPTPPKKNPLFLWSVMLCVAPSPCFSHFLYLWFPLSMSLSSHNHWLQISYLSQSRLFYWKGSHPVSHCCGSDEGFFPQFSSHQVSILLCCYIYGTFLLLKWIYHIEGGWSRSHF